MGNASTKLENVHVVIVGAGYAGTTAARLLSATKCKVTLIEQTDALQHKIAALRGVVVPGWENRVRIPLSNTLSPKHGSSIIQATVAAVEQGKVTLTDGTVLTADFIILAHGAGQMQFPLSLSADTPDSEAYKAKLREKQQVIASASKILLIGGGPVGVELAGEIAAQYPTKEITLVNSGKTLLSNTKLPFVPELIQRATAMLTQIGVNVLNGVRVENLPPSSSDAFLQGDREYLLSNGKTVRVDLAIMCTGQAKQTHIVPAEYLEDGKVKVDGNLQVVNMPTVFCIGDANNVPETKLAFYASNHAQIAVKNIINIEAHKPLLTYVPSQGQKEYGAIFLPIGPQRGVGALGKTVFGSRAVAAIKGKGLLTARSFKDMNAPLPPIAASS